MFLLFIVSFSNYQGKTGNRRKQKRSKLSVQFKTASMRSEKPIKKLCAPPRLSKVFTDNAFETNQCVSVTAQKFLPTMPLKQFRCSSLISRSNDETLTLAKAAASITSFYLCPPPPPTPHRHPTPYPLPPNCRRCELIAARTPRS